MRKASQLYFDRRVHEVLFGSEANGGVQLCLLGVNDGVIIDEECGVEEVKSFEFGGREALLFHLILRLPIILYIITHSKLYHCDCAAPSHDPTTARIASAPSPP